METETSKSQLAAALNKHSVSGKQADLLFLKNFCEEQYEESKTTAWGEQYEKGLQKAYAKVLNQIQFRLACASSAVDKTVSVEMCSCGAIGVTTRHGIDQCEECGKPV